MADYYSHNDPKKRGNDQYLDYDTGGNAKWIWGAIALIALVALIALGSSGGGTIEGAAPAAGVEGAPAATTEMAPAATTETAPAAPVSE